MSSPSQAPSYLICPRCGGSVPVGAHVCRHCGEAITPANAVPSAAPPSAVPPSAAPPPSLPLPESRAIPPAQTRSVQSSHRRSNVWLLLGGGAALVALCLCVCVIGAFYLSPVWMNQGPAPTAQMGGTYDPQAVQALEKSVDTIQTACRAGDVDGVMALTHPALRNTYQPIFSSHKTELKRMADLLSTRKLTNLTDDMAEYQVTENGMTFYVTFEAWGGEWYLSGL